tara:strand:+ start:310 stop:495 length:186 start_codon:yes stop_codon:yes gene_type:complete
MLLAVFVTQVISQYHLPPETGIVLRLKPWPEAEDVVVVKFPLDNVVDAITFPNATNGSSVA